jgi:hypothetical protein
MRCPRKLVITQIETRGHQHSRVSTFVRGYYFEARGVTSREAVQALRKEIWRANPNLDS